jgi:Restriction endonuclease
VCHQACSYRPGKASAVMGKKTWLDYQKLVADIYADLEPQAAVKHDDKLAGFESGIMRQIDVSIRTAIAGHEILVIVQAKELSRPADVNVVGEFQSVIRDVRAAKGVLICSGGYTGPALEYGRKLSIDLCTAHDAQHRKWAVDLKIPLLWIEHPGSVKVAMALVPDRTSPDEITFDENPADWLTSTDSGVTTQTLGQRLANALNLLVWTGSFGKALKVELAEPGMQVLLGTSFWCPARSLECVCDIDRKAWLGAFSVSECRGILNRSTDRFRAKITLSEKDVPISRDQTWPAVDDIETFQVSHPMLVCIVKGIGPKDVKFL